MKTKLSVVIPVFNEEKNIPALVKRLKSALKKVTNNFEIILINDGSDDNSLNEIKKLRRYDRKIKYINFSRNFGHMAALNAGLLHTKGDFVVVMDADLQDPPEVILEMWEKMKEGYNVVYGIKINRKEGIIRKSLFKLFYRIMDLISSYKMPLDVGTFSIIDRQVADILKSLPEKNKYLSGLRFWVGFKQTGVVYSRGSRYKGKPASLRRLFKLALSGFTSFSYIPLRIASILGFFFALAAFLMIILVIVGRLFLGLGIVGWASTISTVLLIGGVQLITLGIIGEYLARIYDEVKKRPEYIISDKAGL